jgi:membrane-associated phospholipid phosphatase
MTRHGFIVAGLALFIAIETALFLFVDRPLALAVQSLDASHPALIAAFRSFTDFGKSAWYLWPSAFGIITCAVICRRAAGMKQRQTAARWGERLLLIFITVAASGLMCDGIKPLMGRARPSLLLRQDIYGFAPFTFRAAWNAMPSGHATTAMTLAFILSCLWARGRPLWLALGILLAISRIMVNAHYLSDTLGGAALAAVTVAIVWHKREKWIFPISSRFFPIDGGIRRL